MAREKILVVDDEPDMLDLCKQILISKGYQVKSAGEGYQAIERAKDEPFDLLLVDIKMPGMNGMETYQAIREFDPDIIGVIITGYASIDTAIKAVKLGFDGFVTKPFTPDELNATVAKALERARLERDNARLKALIPLFELSDAFMTTIHLDDLLHQVVHTAQRETRADRVSLMLLDEATGELTIEAAVGLHLGVVAEAREKAGEGIAGWVTKRGQPLLLDDKMPLDPKIREAMQSDKVSSALCVPLKVKEDRVIGVLNLSKLGGAPFAQTDLELVSIFCGQAAIALENARLFEETERLKVFNESIVQGVAEAILIQDTQGIFTFANPAAEELLGYTHEELIGLPWSAIVPEDEKGKVYHELAKRSKGTVIRYETALLSKEGQVIPVIVSARPLFEDGQFVGVLAAFTDITERKRTEEELAYMATHDALTGLLNRWLLSDRLNLELARAERNRQMLALMLLDLDYFKDVNDTLGHTAGDKLLQVVGRRLRSLVRKSDAVARMGGDEFMLLLPFRGVRDEENATKIAQRILEAFRRPFVFDGHEIRITTSIGIAFYPDDGEDADTLVKNADIAMYRAKAQSRDNYQRYS
jgi:diguanylate cyclase (GGDEF)-like protein/PAS domain S-box-containing protein